MGSRDKRVREKRKPKKQQPKPVSRPLRPAPEYKPPVAPSQPPSSQTDQGTGQ